MMKTLNHNRQKTNVKQFKFLTFQVDQQFYGMEIAKVREIIRCQEFTPVPELPPYILGVINLRGKILPVIDLCQKFRLPPLQVNERTCTIVVSVKLSGDRSCLMGLMVESVCEVRAIPEEDIENAPDFGSLLAAEYINGMAKLGTGVVTLMNIDRVISSTTLEMAVNASEQLEVTSAVA